jgi:hypothetical protein
MVVSMEMHVSDKIQEGTQWEGQCWWMEIHKAAKLFQKFCADNSYSTDESQAGCLSYKHGTWSGSEKALGHVIVLCCSNM